MYLKELDRRCKAYWINLCRHIEFNFLIQNPSKNISDLVNGNMNLLNCFIWKQTPEGYMFWQQRKFQFLHSSICFRDFILKYDPSSDVTRSKNFVNLNKILNKELIS